MGKMSLCAAAVEFNVLVYCRCFWVMWRGWLGSVVVEWLRCVGGFLDRDVEERRRCAGRIVVVGGRESVDMMTGGGLGVAYSSLGLLRRSVRCCEFGYAKVQRA
jgi:hypothetical protein